MQSLVIPISINNEGGIFIPEEFLNILPKEKILKATIEIPDFKKELHDWRNLTTIEFLSGYCDGDSIYDTI